MKKILVRICIAIVALIVIAILAIHFFLDGAVRRGVETVGSKMTRVDVKLDGVHLSLLSGSGKIVGLVVGNPEGFKTPHAISIGKAALALKPGSLLADKVVINSIDVESPEITFEGSLSHDNLKQIRDNLNETTGSNGPGGSNTVAGATPKEEKKANRKLEVDDFQITNAKLDVRVSGVEKTLTLPTIHLTNLGTGPDGITAAELTKKVIGAIEDAAEKEVASNFGDLAKSAANLTKGLGKGAGGSLTNVTKGLGSLFKKQ